MGSNNAVDRTTGRKLIFSVTGYPLGLEHGRLFGTPPMPGHLAAGLKAGADAHDVPDEQGTRERNEEDRHDA